jgi:hypothetical protein
VFVSFWWSTPVTTAILRPVGQESLGGEHLAGDPMAGIVSP